MQHTCGINGGHRGRDGQGYLVVLEHPALYRASTALCSLYPLAPVPESAEAYIIMAYIVMVYIVMAYIVMAYIVLAYIVMV